MDLTEQKTTLCGTILVKTISYKSSDNVVNTIHMVHWRGILCVNGLNNENAFID